MNTMSESQTDQDHHIETDPNSTQLNIVRLWQELRRCRGRCPRRSRSRPRDISPRRFFLNDKERNFVAAFCSTVTVILLSVALYEPSWIYMSGGGCDHASIGAIQFFYNGHFSMRATSDTNYRHLTQDLVYHYGQSQEMVNCVTQKAVKLMKLVICLMLIAIIISFIGLLLDAIGSKKRTLKIIRKNALTSIFTALLCVVINGFTYWVTVELDTLQSSTKAHLGNKVSVSFGMSFYLVAAAGGIAVVGTAFNCLQRRHGQRTLDHTLNDHDRLLDEGPCIDASSTAAHPPAYSP